jgi:mycothiol synthase
MWPVLRSGDAVQVLRCGEDAVAPGDIAVLVREDGGLTAHIVVRTAPVRTASLLGREDAAAELLGRVIRLRTRGVELPVSPRVRPLLRGGQSLVSAAWRNPLLRGAWRWGRGLLASGWRGRSA